MNEAPSTGGRRRPSVAAIAKWAVLVAAVAVMAWQVARQWGPVSHAIATIGWLPVAEAAALAAVALAFNTLSWRSVMASVGLQADLRDAASVFLVSQAGKYVPGAIWPVVAQAEFARSHGLSRARGTVGSLVAMAVGVVAAGVVGGVGAAVFAPGSVGEYWWALALAAALAACLHPAILTRLIALALKVLRRSGEPVSIGGKALAASAGWSALNWLALGGQAWVLITALGGTGATFGLATGAFALAWLAGFLFVIAPAGAGVREWALVALLASVATKPEATALALLSRFALTLADAVGLGIGAAMRRSRREPRDRTASP